MTDEKLEQMKQAAEGATKGDWQVEDRRDNQFIVSIRGKKREYVFALPGLFARNNDFKFAATCSPVAVLELIQEVESLRHENRLLKEFSTR